MTKHPRVYFNVSGIIFDAMAKDRGRTVMLLKVRFVD
jgi:hypothetical protein